jgi:cytochrome bd-type quinol oxidase subunit 1
VGALADPAQDVHEVALVLARRDLGRAAPVRDEHSWLVADRERPAAVDRARPQAHAEQRVPVSFTDLVISMVAFGVLYTVLGVLDVVLMLRYSRKQIDLAPAPIDDQARAPSMLY